MPHGWCSHVRVSVQPYPWMTPHGRYIHSRRYLSREVILDCVVSRGEHGWEVLTVARLSSTPDRNHRVTISIRPLLDATIRLILSSLPLH